VRVKRLLKADDGQVLPLVLAYGLIAGALVMVAVDAGKVFLDRRALVAAADGAALAAAQSLDRAAYYRHGANGALPLDADAATRAVQGYAAAAGLEARFTELRLDPAVVSDDGRTVTVRLHATVTLPFTGYFTGGRRQLTLDATASAQSAISV
jgi:uncharacterized membrane protein